MEFLPTKFEGCFQLKLDVFGDNRGSFVKMYSSASFEPKHLSLQFHELFYSVSKKGVIRGMHFQNPPFDQAKLVTVIEGSIIDVIVDLRTKAPTFGEHQAFELKAERGGRAFHSKGFCAWFSSIDRHGNCFLWGGLTVFT
jgi:dTDP-4-dehydrorhamnose 3,5-epimerase